MNKHKTPLAMAAAKPEEALLGCGAAAVVFVVAASLILSGLFHKKEAPPQKTSSDLAYEKAVGAIDRERARAEDNYAEAKRAMRGALKYPESALFIAAYSDFDGSICGSYDAKNSLGVYGGGSAQYIYTDGRLATDENLGEDKFQRLWDQHCNNPRFRF